MSILRPVPMAAAVLLLTTTAAPAASQVIGTFTWHTAPSCNVLTLTVVQQGGTYQLTGADNLCGAGVAVVTGTAIPGGSGVVFGMTAALPSGGTTQVTASISLATLSGSWWDSNGNTGAFTFGPSGGGAPRPVGSSITLPGGGFTARDDFPVFQGGTACFRNNTPASGLRHTIPVSAGTTVTALTIRTTASVASQLFTVTMFRQAPDTTSGGTVATASFTPAAVGLSTSTITLPIAELVSPGEAVYVAFSSASTSVFLCAVQVHLTKP